MDYGSRYTDRREKILDLRLQKVYLEAQKDLEKKFDSFLKKSRRKGAEMWQKLIDGEITREDYGKWMRGQVFIGNKWQNAIDQMTELLKNTNQIALNIIREEQYGVYAENANYQAYQIEKDTNSEVSFDLYDKDTVDRLVRERPELLPRKMLNGKKDRAWNQGVISNAVTQAILQGESIPELARRLARDTANTDMNAMTRYARTAMTCAQNAGRIDTMHRAEDMGVYVRKKWISTLDGRTRDSHRQLDGQEQDVDAPFESELGPIMFPGDPNAEPGNVYNCRCTLGYSYPEYQKGQIGTRRDNETGEVIADMSYSEWIAEKESGGTDTRRKEEDVTEEYYRNAKPGVGKIRYDKKNSFTDDKDEIVMARLIRKLFGGDIEVRQEIDITEGVKYNDYIWKGRYWDLKTKKTPGTPDGLLKKGVGQIRKNPGGIILNYECKEFDLERILGSAKKRLETCGFDLDLMIFHKKKLICIKRYKNKRTVHHPTGDPL